MATLGLAAKNANGAGFYVQSIFLSLPFTAGLCSVMHRTFSITTPPLVTEQLCQQLIGLETVISLNVALGASRKPAGDIITVQVLNRGTDAVLRRVQNLLPPEQISISSTELSSLISPSQATLIMGDKDEAVWEEIESGLRHQGRPTANYRALMALGGVMAAVGLVSEPVPQVTAFIASSILAPGFEPLAAMPLGVVLRRWHVLWRGLRSTLLGYTLFILAAGLTMLLLVATGASSAEELAHNPEVLSMVQPDLKSILVSACGAAAGIIIIAAYRRSVIAGALIALILMPAAALIGCGLAVGRSHLALEGLTRFGLDVGLVLGLGLLIFQVKQLFAHRRRPSE